MANLRWRADSPRAPQVNTLTPANVAIGNNFNLMFNGKSVSYNAAAALVSDVTAGLVAAVNSSTIPEFAEVIAVDNGINLTLTARTPGVPFTQTSSASGGSATLTTVSGAATPVNAAFSTSSTGGTLAGNATYYYRVSATTAAGETLASTETSQNVPAGTNTNTVTVNWSAAVGATGYNVYGRSMGAEQLIARLGNVLTYTDTGAVTPSGALPTVNASISSGPNDWSVPGNWDSGTVPANGDTATLEGPVDILYGLAQAAVTLAALNILSTFTGKLGLPAYNGQYWEYRPTELAIGATTITVGEGPGPGSNHLRINRLYQN